MIIPSIDLSNGQAVQLIGGEKLAIEAGDPLPIAERFRLAGEIAVIDLDAAIGTGANAPLVEKLLAAARCRVGGGIRGLTSAIRWLDAGAAKIIIGTKAEPELLRELPKERLIAALDARQGEVVVEGWRKGTGRNVLERIAELREFVSGFLVTFVETEGRLGGINLEQVKEVVAAAGNTRVTAAGGVSSLEEIRIIDELGADAQVGMALYTNKIDLGDAIAAPLKSDRADGLWPTIVVDEHEVALGLAWSSAESLREAVRTRRGVYQSRKRGLWRKGETSGAAQELLRIDLDCDRDALRFVVKQSGSGFCHTGARTCWGEDQGLGRLSRLLASRKSDAPEGSYTARLFSEAGLLEKKIKEEAGELAAARNSREVAAEAADVLYFTLVRMAKESVSLADVAAELDRRSLKVTRRPGNAKEGAN